VNCPYRQIAADRWKGVEISGTGRYALVARKDGIAIAVYLTENHEAAKASQPFYDSAVIDLKPVDFDRIPDRMDADERRRERRERQAQQ
jgi:hypothetical protein